MYFVYVLKDGDTGKHYIGSCEDLDRRLREHRRKKPSYQLVYKEARESRSDALRRELYLKSGNGRRALKSVLREFERA
jgi:putative endonuclease